jgi:hypothetical protein
MNRPQKMLLLVSGSLLLCLLLFPPWHQAAQREVSYRKELGRAFLLAPPNPEAVECYFAGRTTAPSSYFHVLLNWRVLIADCIPIVVIALALLWMFRSRQDGTHPTLKAPKTRLAFSMFVALVLPIPALPLVPLGSMLPYTLPAIMEGGVEWIWPILLPLLFALYFCTVYLLVTVALRITARRHAV